MKIRHLLEDFHGIVSLVIDRKSDLARVRAGLRRSRVVALLGPRQCGKTTLARQFVAADSINYFDLDTIVVVKAGPTVAARSGKSRRSPPGLMCRAPTR